MFGPFNIKFTNYSTVVAHSQNPETKCQYELSMLNCPTPIAQAVSLQLTNINCSITIVLSRTLYFQLSKVDCSIPSAQSQLPILNSPTSTAQVLLSIANWLTSLKLKCPTPTLHSRMSQPSFSIQFAPVQLSSLVCSL